MPRWRYGWLFSDDQRVRLVGIPYAVFEVATGRRRLTAYTTREGRYRLPADRTRAYRMYLLIEGRTRIMEVPAEPAEPEGGSDAHPTRDPVRGGPGWRRL